MGKKSSGTRNNKNKWSWSKIGFNSTATWRHADLDTSRNTSHIPSRIGQYPTSALSGYDQTKQNGEMPMPLPPPNLDISRACHKLLGKPEDHLEIFLIIVGSKRGSHCSHPVDKNGNRKNSHGVKCKIIDMNRVTFNFSMFFQLPNGICPCETNEPVVPRCFQNVSGPLFVRIDDPVTSRLSTHFVTKKYLQHPAFCLEKKHPQIQLFILNIQFIKSKQTNKLIKKTMEMWSSQNFLCSHCLQPQLVTGFFSTWKVAPRSRHAAQSSWGSEKVGELGPTTDDCFQGFFWFSSPQNCCRKRCLLNHNQIRKPNVYLGCFSFGETHEVRGQVHVHLNLETGLDLNLPILTQQGTQSRIVICQIEVLKNPVCPEDIVPHMYIQVWKK